MNSTKSLLVFALLLVSIITTYGGGIAAPTAAASGKIQWNLQVLNDGEIAITYILQRSGNTIIFTSIDHIGHPPYNPYVDTYTISDISACNITVNKTADGNQLIHIYVNGNEPKTIKHEAHAGGQSFAEMINGVGIDFNMATNQTNFFDQCYALLTGTAQ